MIFKPLFAGYKTGPWGWNGVLTPVEELENRLKKVKEEMAERDIEALLIFGAGDPTWKNGNICYLTNSNVCYARWDALIVTKENDPTFIGNFIPRDIPWEVRASSWLKDVRIFNGAVEGVKRVFRGLNLNNCRIGLIGAEGLDVKSHQDLLTALPDASFIDLTDMIEKMRMIKSKSERYIISKAGNIADFAMNRVSDFLIEGRDEHEVIADIEMAARNAGSHNSRFLIATGPDAELGLRMPENRKLKKGDMVLIIAAFEHWQYWAQISRTYVVGAPSEKQTIFYDEILKAYENILGYVEPDITPNHLTKTIIGAMESTGHREYLKDSYGFGHGVGVSIEEKPFIGEGDDLQLKAGMTIAIQIGLHVPGTGGALLSDTLLLTESGVQRLTKATYDL